MRALTLELTDVKKDKPRSE